MARLEEFPSVSETILLALLRDEPGALGAACTPLNESTIDKYYDWHDGTCFQARTLLQLAVTFSAGRCSAALLQGGADPNLKSPTDGKTALHCACLKGLSPASINLIAYLLRHGGNVSIPDFSGSIPTDLLIKMNENNAQIDARMIERGEPVKNERFETDEFRMYSFKIECCPKLGELHDWGECPYLHPGEKARRRDPRICNYEAVPCPEFRKGTCKRGDWCPYAHGVFECWLHPSRYRTSLCREGASCGRAVCFFAHTMDQLREPGSSQSDIGRNVTPQVKTEYNGDNGAPQSPRATIHNLPLSGTTSTCSSPRAGRTVLSTSCCSRQSSLDDCFKSIVYDSAQQAIPGNGPCIDAIRAMQRQQNAASSAQAARLALNRILQTANAVQIATSGGEPSVLESWSTQD